MRLNARKPALYLLDEPEAALSPARQLALLSVLNQHERTRLAQFIIATHSPILLAYPGAKIYTFDEGPLHTTRHEDTTHYAVTRRFLEDPDSMLRTLFQED